MNWLEQIKGISSATHNNLTVIMGKIGTRKTTSAGTYPKPILYITIGTDGGEEVLKSYNDDDIKILNLESDSLKTKTTTTPKHIYAKMMEVLQELKSPHPFKTVVIDPYSGIEEGLVKFFEEQKGKKLNQPEWGIVGGMMLNMRDTIADLARGTVEYVLVCHTKENRTVDSVTGKESIEIVPKMTLRNGSSLLEKASNVMYACRKTVLSDGGIPEVKFLMYIGAHPYMDTKIRLPNAENMEKGMYIENFTYDKLQEMIKNNKFESDVTVVEQQNPFDDDEEKSNSEEI